MARSRRRSKKKHSHDFMGVILIVGSLLAIASVGYWYYKESSSRVEIDPSTNCPISGADSITAILIDTTDSLTRDQALYLNKKLSSVVLDSNKFARFDVYFLNQSVDKIEPSISVCNPGDGKDKSELTNNKRRLKQVWEHSFFDKLSELFSSLRDVPQADQSPIVEGLKFVSIDAFVGNEASHKELIIVSDLLQHSPLMSQYGVYSEVIDENQSLASTLPYLDDVNVSFMYVVRPSNRQLQTNRHMVFWENLVLASGGKLASVELVK